MVQKKVAFLPIRRSSSTDRVLVFQTRDARAALVFGSNLKKDSLTVFLYARVAQWTEQK